MPARRRPPARVWAALALLAILSAGCGAGASSPARAPAQGPAADPAVASAAGDERTVAAIRKDADLACPARATAAGQDHPSPPGRRLQVATTVAPLTSIAASVAGDRADVRGVVPEGSDSHTFEPKPSVAELFTRADVVFVNGLSLEDPTRDLARRNVGAGAQVVELGPLVLSPDEYIYDFSFPRPGGKPNPHLWTDPPLARCYAAAMASVMARADPANAAYYAANATRFEARVDDLDARFKAASDRMAPRQRELLTYHDAYAYFAAHYRWRVIGAVQVSSFEDPTPREVAALIAQVKAEKVPAIFGSEVFPSPVLAQIGREAGVRYVDQLRDDDLPGRPGESGHSYLGLMKADFVTMVSNLGGDATGLSAFDDSDTAPVRAAYPQ